MNHKLNKDAEQILTISPVLVGRPSVKKSGWESVKRELLKFSNRDYESIRSLNKSDVEYSSNWNNTKIQIK